MALALVPNTEWPTNEASVDEVIVAASDIHGHLKAFEAKYAELQMVGADLTAALFRGRAASGTSVVRTRRAIRFWSEVQQTLMTVDDRTAAFHLQLAKLRDEKGISPTMWGDQDPTEEPTG